VSNLTALYSSATSEWETPPEEYDYWHRIFQFDLDAAATTSNAKVPRYLGLGGEWPDALTCDWAQYGTRIWLNPPYGRVIGQFTAKARAAAERGALVCALLPARTDTGWWHRDVVGGGAVVMFRRGRVQFLRDRVRLVGAPFPSAVAIWFPARRTT
jgi:phage N-6-adenine-methyltransferase